MTINEAKKAVASSLNMMGTEFTKLSARSVSFEGLGFGRSIFVTIHGVAFTNGWKETIMQGVPKPSEGGYCIETENCTFNGHKMSFS